MWPASSAPPSPPVSCWLCTAKPNQKNPLPGSGERIFCGKASLTARQIGICRYIALARERPRLPLEGKLSPSRATDEVCREMLCFQGVPGEFATFSTSSDRPSGGHLPLKGKPWALPRQCLTSSNPNLQLCCGSIGNQKSDYSSCRIYPLRYNACSALRQAGWSRDWIRVSSKRT